MDNGLLKKHYQDNKDDYNRLGVNLVENLKLLLNQKGIKYSSIKHRIKTEESLIEKFERKEYSNIEDLEDFCGIRIVCFYKDDIKKIEKLISSQLDVIEKIDKDKDSIEEGKFWYRGKHFVVKIKKQWGTTPVFNGLEGLKVEIQVRTILMDAWAEIEHTLSYKSTVDIPKEIEREFSTISCFLEDIDGKFQNLQGKVEDYIQKISGKITSGNFKGIGLDKNSLELLLVNKGILRKEGLAGNKNRVSGLLETLEKNSLTLDQLSTLIEKNEKYIKEFGIEYGRNFLGMDDNPEVTVPEPPTIWVIMQIIRLLYEKRVLFKNTKKEKSDKFIIEWSKKLYKV